MTTHYHCPACNGGRFFEAERVNVQWTVSNHRNSARVFNDSARVCAGCGRTELFMADPEGWASAVEAREVEADRDHPYRQAGARSTGGTSR